MTPEQAESIYYAEYGRLRQFEDSYDKPVNQKRIRLGAYQKLIDEIRAEYARELAGQMLNAITEDAKT